MTKKQQRIIDEYYRNQGIKTILCKRIITNRNNVNFRITEIPYTVAISDIVWYFVDGRLKNYRFDNRLYKLENIFMPSDSSIDTLISLDGLKQYIHDCGINPNVNHTLAMYVFKSVEHVLTHNEYTVPSMISVSLLHKLVKNYNKITGLGLGNIWDMLNERLAKKYGLDVFSLKTGYDNDLSIPKYMLDNPQVTNLILSEIGLMIREASKADWGNKYYQMSNGNGEVLSGYNPDDDSDELK